MSSLFFGTIAAALVLEPTHLLEVEEEEDFGEAGRESGQSCGGRGSLPSLFFGTVAAAQVLEPTHLLEEEEEEDFGEAGRESGQ